jgi:hypothetical protein
MLFHARVEETALKRRTSRLLLPLPVSQRKPKVRELVLTSHRLLCLKPLKSGRGVGIKAQFGLREAQAPATGREKRPKGDEARGMITGVERKSAKEFVVMTVRVYALQPGAGFFFLTRHAHRRASRLFLSSRARLRQMRGCVVWRRRCRSTARRTASASSRAITTTATATIIIMSAALHAHDLTYRRFYMASSVLLGGSQTRCPSLL